MYVCGACICAGLASRFYLRFEEMIHCWGDFACGRELEGLGESILLVSGFC